MTATAKQQPEASNPERITANGSVFNIPLFDIAENPSNHRHHYDLDAMKELSASIKEHGVLMPVLVRPRSGAKGNEAKYELVYGHRRFRAAAMADLAVIPAQLRELNDRQVLEVALIENCRRQDILPMEEAHAYEDLVEKHKLTVEEVALRTSKSQSYVYARMKLTALQSKAACDALDEGRISPSVALLIARIPIPKLQDEAAKEILEGEYDIDSGAHVPMGARRALELVTSKYMVRLATAPFDPEDASLVSTVEVCSACPKRTGNLPKGLYPETKDPNICTDPVCFAGKKKAAFKLEKLKLAEKGQEFLGEKPGLFDDHGRLTYNGSKKYVELSDVCHDDPKRRTYKELCGDTAPVIVALDKAMKEHKLVAKEDLPDAIRVAGHKVKVQVPDTKSWEEKHAQEKVESDFRLQIATQALELLVQKEEQRSVTMVDYLQELALELTYRDSAVGQRRNLDEKEMRKTIKEATASELRGLIFEALHGRAILTTWNGYSPQLENFCTEHGIKLKQLEQAAKDVQEKAAKVIAENVVAQKSKKRKSEPKAEKKSRPKKARA